MLTNIVPKGMSREELYEGYRKLLARLYSYRNYRQRVMQLILNKGSLIQDRIVARRQDFAILARVMWHCVVRASPKRSLMTLSLLAETMVRRPKAIKVAVTLALQHKHMYEYMRETCRELDGVIAQLKQLQITQPIAVESAAS